MLTKAIKNLNCSNGSSILFWAFTLYRARTLFIAPQAGIFAACPTEGGWIIVLAICSMFTSLFVDFSWALQITIVTGQRTCCWTGRVFINGNACIRLPASIRIGSPSTLHVSFRTMNRTHLSTAFWVLWHAGIGLAASFGINCSWAHDFIRSAIYWAMCWAVWVLCDADIFYVIFASNSV